MTAMLRKIRSIARGKVTIVRRANALQGDADAGIKVVSLAQQCDARTAMLAHIDFHEAHTAAP